MADKYTVDDKKYWEKYYRKNRVPGKPSDFAKFVCTYLVPEESLLELGCGCGRDSVFLSEVGKQDVSAIDQCDEQVEFLNKNYGTESLRFVENDFTRMPKAPEKYHNIYSRWTIHAISTEGENRVIRWISDNLISGGKFYIEARSINDDLYGKGEKINENAFVTDHYRRFMDLGEFVKKLKDADFKILYSMESRGLAIYKDDDPVIIRIIAERL